MAVVKEKLSVEDFGRQLIKTRDLDPVYVGIVGARLEQAQLERLLLAYWSFYDLGLAAYLSGLTDSYWGWMISAAQNEGPPPNTRFNRWPRATERRHFRGPKCVKAVLWLRDKYPEPQDAVESLYSSVTAEETIRRVNEWPMFGPWIAFKAADMLERVAGIPLKFDRDIGLMYKEPQEGLRLLVEERGRDPGYHYRTLLTKFQFTPAPPTYNRYCGPQEVETVLCKWKSHMNGHYKIGKDIHEVREALRGWGETAQKILNAMPMEVG